MSLHTITRSRVDDAIVATRATLATLPAEDVAKVDATLALDFGEHFHYQQLQAEAHAGGTISSETAMAIYAALGEVGSASNGGWSAGVDVATKYVVTDLIRRLLEARLGR